MLFSLYLALYNVDPAELGLRFQETAAMINNTGNPSNQSDRSKERGIIDILEVKARMLNSVLDKTKRFKDLEVIHTGTEVIDKGQEMQILAQQQSTIYSTDQLRALRDEKPLWEQAKEGGIDDEDILNQIKLMGSLPTSATAMAVLSNILMAAAQEKQMQQQQEMQDQQMQQQGGGQPGEGGEEGQPGGDDEGGDQGEEVQNTEGMPEYEDENSEEGKGGGEDSGAINLVAKKKPKELQKSKRKFTVEI